MATRCICPHCRTVFKIDHIEEKVGTKIRCGYCNGKILIQAPPVKKAAVEAAALKTAPNKAGSAKAAPIKDAPVKKKKRPEPEVIELDTDAIVVDDTPNDDFQIPDMEYGVDDYAEAELVEEPVQNHQLRAASRPTKKKSEGFQEAAVKERAPKRTQVRSSAIFLWGAAGAVVLCSLVAVIVILASAAGPGGTKFEEPEEYVEFSPKNLQLSATVPKGWEENHGGGTGGIPIFATFTSGKVSIEIRESRSGGAIGAANIAMQGNQTDPKEAVEGVHEMQRTVVAENFGSYKEDAEPRPIKTQGFGTGMVSDFDADQGMLGGGRVRGCRATVMNQLHQFNVICKCPAGMFEQVQPIFEKVIESLGG
jgi:DNA-directed RNA polymerase subunit RPC12/RpoP